MAAYSGPTTTMPGSFHAVPEGTMCDGHPDRRAVSRIQGETDSQGALYVDCCMECRERVLHLLQQLDFPGQCELCGLFKERLRNWRDPNEGIMAQSHRVCTDCIEENASLMVRESASGRVVETHEAAEEREEIANMALDHFEHHPEDGEEEIDAASLFDDSDLADLPEGLPSEDPDLDAAV